MVRVSIVTAIVAVWVFCGVIVLLIATHAVKEPVLEPFEARLNEDLEVAMLDSIWEMDAWRP